MAEWEEALDKQMSTWAFLDSPNGRAYIDNFIDNVSAKYPWELPMWRRMQQTARQSLWEADPVYVTREMMALLEAAVPTFEAEPLREDDLLVKRGFAYFPQSIMTQDVNGRSMGMRAMAWHPVVFNDDGPDGKPGLLVTFFSHPGDDDEGWKDNPELRREFFGDSLAVSHQMPIIFGQEPTNMGDSNPWDNVVTEEQKARIKLASLGLHLYCQVLWRLMGQRIAVGFKQRSPRGQRKRVERAGWTEKYITVVTLRRPKAATADDEHHAVDWTHRWIVGGHWRWQPYKDGVRQIWISPYVKGPEDKPLVIRGARVFRLAR